MSNYVNQNSTFEFRTTQARECPHCGVHAQLIPTASPSFEYLMAARPTQVALGFSCSACAAPRFGRALVRAYDADRVELSDHIVEIERVKERFQFGYLPDEVRRLFAEALDCYSADCHNAFASMCRRTIGAAIASAPDVIERRLRAALSEVVELGQLGEATAATFEDILFADSASIPEVMPEQSAVLIEVMKDLLYQIFVRTAKFTAAMQMRRFFAEESSPKVTSIRRRRGRTPPVARNG